MTLYLSLTLSLSSEKRCQLVTSMNILSKLTERVNCNFLIHIKFFLGEWLNSTQSLNEQSVPDDAIILIEKKFFVTDATLSTEDPLTLHLVYIQCRDSILAGKHPMTEEEALTFGALQCQILYGNYDPNKNKVLEYDQPTLTFSHLLDLTNLFLLSYTKPRKSMNVSSKNTKSLSV